MAMTEQAAAAARKILCGAVLFVGFGSPIVRGAEAPLPERVEFNRDIRPIFSNACFKCHGPDAKTREGKLRFDVRSDAIAEHKHGVPIVPGDPGRSEAWKRVISTDPDARMPPPESHLDLSKRQIALLEKWIAQGAEYQDHWAYIAPTRPPEPKVAGGLLKLPFLGRGPTVRNPIDAFILAGLGRDGLKPSPEADRATLIRRVTLDLTGLPPTLAEVDAFVADKRADAYEQLVERLLANPHYGERMALDWLDAARFADTHGYQIDFGRDMSAWREWVIDAYNNNQPFNQFTIEQLAGDLLPNATLSQKVASGFSRNAMANCEGGVIAEEYQYAYSVDRVTTAGTVWLGMTMGCAQCHDHKYDPISTLEFHEMTAFFNNVAERIPAGRANVAPEIKVPLAKQRETLTRLSADIAELEKTLTGADAQADAAQAAWEAQQGATAETSWQTLVPNSMDAAGKGVMTRQEDGAILVSGANPAVETYTVIAPLSLTTVTALRVEALPDDSMPAKGPGRSGNGNAVMTDVRMTVTAPGGAATKVVFTAATADFSQDTFPVTNAIDGDGKSGWALYPEVGKRHVAIFESGQAVTAVPGSTVTVTLDFQSQFGSHQFGRFRLALTDARNPTADTSGVRELLAIAADKRTEAQRTALRDYYRQNMYPPAAGAAVKLAAARKAYAEEEKQVATTMVMEELPQPRDTFLRVRGQYDNHGPKVTPNVPVRLGAPMPEDAPPNRLGLAQWLVNGRNPLTARVIVNRYWQNYFGTGLVDTPGDFGSQGSWPTNPELLDWLATEFVESGWDVKHMQRLIVESATYRQQSVITPEQLEADPANRLLARGARFRLPAEIIRDQALAIGGLLNDEIGGKSVTVYQPDGLWEELGYRADGAYQRFTQSHGNDLYRRSMYIYAKRTCPQPFLATFDASDRQNCVVARQRTNTPLQALALMNDPAFIEASRKLAERILSEPTATVAGRIAFAFRLATARLPSKAEAAILAGFYDQQLETYRKDPQLGKDLLAVGESPVNGQLDPAEFSAWTMVASAILNLDETVTKQ